MTVKHDKDWEEYQVTPVYAGKPRAAATYFTSDRGDAMLTAAVMLASMTAKDAARRTDDVTA